MRIGLQISLLFMAASLLSSCASLNQVKEAFYKDSTLENLNPAPQKLAPPPQVDEDSLMIDPLYLRSQADYHYTYGEALSLEGKTERATEEFKLVLVYDPDSVMVRLRLAAEYVKQGLVSEAIEQAEAAVGADETSIDARLMLGGLYSSLKMYNMALAQYQEILRIDPKLSEISIYIGALLAEQKNYDEAEKHFQTFAKDPNTKEPHLAYYYIGRVRAEQGGAENLKKAEHAYNRSLVMKPDSERVVLALAGLYEATEREAQAIKLLESFQRQFGPRVKVSHYLSQKYLNQENYNDAFRELENLAGFEPDNLNVRMKMALILIDKKAYRKAADVLEEIVAVAPESDKIRFYLGAVYEELKDYDIAIEHFSRVPSSSTYYPEAVIHTAHLHKLQGELKQAVVVIQRGIDNRSDIPQFYSYYASFLEELKDYAQAVRLLNQAVEKFPTHQQLRFFLGSMHDRVGEVDRTIAHMKKILELNENHIQALNYLAYTYAQQEIQLKEAEQLAFKALRLSPDDGYILDTVGWVLYKQGRFEEAIQYLEAALRSDVSDSESVVAEHLGDAYYRYELVEKAKQMYIKAVAVAKDEKKKQELRTKIVSIEQQRAEQHDSKERKPASK